MAAITLTAKRETAKGSTAIMRSADGTTKGTAPPVLYCSEIIDRPALRDAIQKAAIQLAPSYDASTAP